MNFPRRKFLQWAGSAASLPLLPAQLQAASYPVRPLRWIVGFAPGGAADVITRLVAAQLSDQLGQQVVVENRPGAGASLATNALLAAPADGHTLLLLGSSTVVHALLQESQPSLLKHIVPVAGLTVSAFVIAVHPQAPYATLADLIADARANPGYLKVGSYGVGTQSHIAAQLFSDSSGIDIVHVPYRGGAPLVADLLGRHIDVAFDSVASSISHSRDGSLRLLAVTSAERLKELPDIPAASETIVGYEILVWTGVGVREGTSLEIVERLNREVNAALADAKISDRIASLAISLKSYNPDEFAAFWSSEMARTLRIIQDLGIRLQ